MSKKIDFVNDTIYEPFYSGNGRRNRANPANQREALLESMYTRILMELCINRFKWSGIDEDDHVGINVRFMELTLMRFGLAVVFEERSSGKVIAMQGTPSGQLNWVQEPIAYTVVGNMFGARTLGINNCVPVWSNFLRYPDLDVIYVYAKKLAQIDRSIEINAQSARRPKVAFMNENQRLSVVNINRQIDEGTSFIGLNSDMMQGADVMAPPITALDLGVDPDTIVNLHILRTRLWGECMGFLGFDYANQDKKERLVASEVDANNSQVDAMRAVNLNARKIACEQINTRYGTQLDVEYHITSETSEAAIPEAPTLTGVSLSPGSTSSGE